MKLARTTILISALMALATVARADPMLDQWIAAAMDRNPDLAVARRNWEASQQKIAAARSFEDPQIGADLERMGTTRLDTFTDVEWMISQKLPWFGKRGARISVAALEAEATGLRYLELARDIRSQVRVAYWNLWLEQRIIGVNAENKFLLAQLQDTARSRYEAGLASQADVLRAQVALAKLGSDLVTLEREATVAQAGVNRLLNAPSDTPRDVAAIVESPGFALSLDQLNEQAGRYCTRVLEAARLIQSKESAVRAAKLEYAPDIEFRVEARQYNGQSGIQEYDTGVFLNFPWLWRGKYQAGIRGARAELEMARAEHQKVWNDVLFELKTLYTKADAARRQVRLYEATVLPQARQSVEATRSAYQVNRATFLELLDAQRALQDFELDHFRARAEWGKTVAQIEQITGPFGATERDSGLVKTTQEVKP